jgi:hypothetical protein
MEIALESGNEQIFDLREINTSGTLYKKKRIDEPDFTGFLS